MISETPSKSDSPTTKIETDNHVTMNNEPTSNGTDQDENDLNEIQDGGSDGTADKSSNGIKLEKTMDGTSNNVDKAGEANSSNDKKIEHHTVTPEDVIMSESNEYSSIKEEDEGASSSPTISSKNTEGELKTEKNTNDNNGTVVATVPLLKGILTYIDNESTRKHTITGMWNFESAVETQPQSFQLTRNLGPDEDPKELPRDGEFNGSFRVMYTSISSNGKTKKRTKIIAEQGVKLAFLKQDGEEDSYDVKGQGTNQYGVFSLYGTAIRDQFEKDKAYKVELRKKYISIPDAATVRTSNLSSGQKSSNQKRKLSESDKTEEPLPDPLPSHPSNVVSLRGNLTRDSSVQDGVVHCIKGLWSTGLDLLLSDPKNEHGFCNEFEYEHRSTVGTDAFPISGRYTGWFNYTENGTTSRITERDVILKFKKNNGGFYNVEGKGTNMFGKYNITGSLDKENIITLFRHFAPIKVKKSSESKALMESTQGSDQKSAFPRMTLDDVEVPNQTSYDPVVTPIDGHYQAVSRGTFKVNEDGAHTCSGKWAQTRAHHTTNMTNNFHFGLEEHHAKQAIDEMKKNGVIEEKDSSGGRIFPVDSANYKGSFKMKKGTQPIIDQQVVMKFRKNTLGSYNIYGKGVNAYGTFDLIGTLIAQGPSSGSVEIFRIYAPLPEVQAPPSKSQSKAKSLPLAKNASSKKLNDKKKSAPAPGLIRRESSRQVKVPLHLADDDPEAHHLRMMEKCSAILKLIQEKDASGGAYFLEPVDPVAHNIPTYHQVITNPMDLGTIQEKMEAGEIESPAEFARLMRLVFENAVTFNNNPMNFVHQTARDLLSIFNQKYRDIERMIQPRKPSKNELKEMKKKQMKEEQRRIEIEKKRKREEEKNPRLKQLSIIKMSSNEIKKAVDALDAATSAGILQSPTLVSRNEFNVMTNVIKHIQSHMLHMQSLFQELTTTSSTQTSSSVDNFGVSSTADGIENSAPKKHRKAKKSKSQAHSYSFEPEIPFESVSAPIHEPVLVVEEPLTHEEQEELLEEINMMTEEKIQSVIDIIKKSKRDLVDDDQEIELELDQLDTATQRKLYNFAMKVGILQSSGCYFF